MTAQPKPLNWFDRMERVLDRKSRNRKLLDKDNLCSTCGMPVRGPAGSRPTRPVLVVWTDELEVFQFCEWCRPDAEG